MLQVLKSGNCSGQEAARHLARVAALVRRVEARLSLTDPETVLAAEVLEACNAFDEAVEFAPYERVGIASAISAFQDEFGPELSPRVRQALNNVTVAKTSPRKPDRLPVMPRAAAQILRTSDETTSPAELRLIAASDPVLCARLLQVANSARFGGREPISNLTDAAARLGVPLARKVLLSACFAPLFASRPLQDLWRHSQQVAAAAAEAARHASFDTDIAYTAGLLHDVGRIVFETSPADSTSALRDWERDGFPLSYAETLTFGQDHACAGADLLRDWELPGPIVDAIANHHQPEQAGSMLASLVFLAEECARRSSNSVSECMAASMRLAHAEAVCGFPPDALSEWRSDAELLALAG